MIVSALNFEQFTHSFVYMGKGMLGIFLVIGLIVLISLLLNKITSKKD